jgi:hypothetical protein
MHPQFIDMGLNRIVSPSLETTPQVTMPSFVEGELS